jgi:hypothetical protein
MILRWLTVLVTLLLIPPANGAHTPETVRCAVIGDFYNATAGTQRVANLVKGWNPDVIISTGDNTNDTSVAEMDRQVGQFYGAYIHYPAGSPSVYAPGPAANKFYPSLGNHDYERIVKNGFPYFVVGTGGTSLYGFRDPPDPDSLVRFNTEFGALRIEATPTALTFIFFSIAGGGGGTLIDTYELQSAKTLFLPLVITNQSVQILEMNSSD